LKIKNKKMGENIGMEKWESWSGKDKILKF
jgi:hypothetical protein